MADSVAAIIFVRQCMLRFTSIGTGFSEEQSKKLNSGLEAANVVLASQEFRAAVLAIQNLSETDDSPSLIYQKLTAAEIAFPVRSYVSKLPWSKAIASERDGEIFYNLRRFDELTLRDLVENLVHEASHKVGYAHRSNFAARSWNTAPYQVGRAAGTAGDALGLWANVDARGIKETGVVSSSITFGILCAVFRATSRRRLRLSHDRNAFPEAQLLRTHNV